MDYNGPKSNARIAAYLWAPIRMLWLKATKWELQDRLLDGFSQNPIDLNRIYTSQRPGRYLSVKTLQQNQYEL